ncbi:MAG: phytanoyl-CoA dioxygenase family protein [Ferruginibacter sp.]
MIRRLKMAYMLFNLFNKRKLIHNARFYKSLGLRKWYFSSISSKDFISANKKLLKTNENFIVTQQTTLFKESDSNSQNSISNFDTEGYAIISKYLDNDTIAEINNEIESLIETKKVKLKYGNKIVFAIHKSALLKQIGNDHKLTELLSSLLGGKVKLFQSINFLHGSEQKTHSDSIHMTTFPLGGLLGVWIALEDIDMDNGPLHYYPKSHTLPYYLNSDYNNEGNYFLIGDKDYREYEKMIEKKLIEHNMQKKVFTAKKGDLLIWHANLFHGGEPHLNRSKTRKSMVFHYFNENSICYHEISQRPALIN